MRRILFILCALLVFGSAADAVTITQPGSTLASVAGLPNIRIIGTSTRANGAAETSQSITTVTGVSNGDCLLMCVGAATKPTTTINTLAGWTQVSTGGQLADGVQNTQAALFARVVDGTENASYSPSWTGSANGAAAEIAIRGLAQCTSPTTTYNNSSTSAGFIITSTPASGTFASNQFDVGCGMTNVVTTFISTYPNSVQITSDQRLMMTAGFNVLAPIFQVNSASVWAVAGAVMQ